MLLFLVEILSICVFSRFTVSSSFCLFFFNLVLNSLSCAARLLLPLSKPINFLSVLFPPCPSALSSLTPAAASPLVSSPLLLGSFPTPFRSLRCVVHLGGGPEQYLLLQTPLMFTEQMQQDVIMVLKFPSNSPVTHVAANTQPGLTSPAIITVTANRLFAVNKWHGLTGVSMHFM